DDDIYVLLVKYFENADVYFWSKASERSYIIKTVGIQALFDILRNIARDAEMRDIPDKANSLFRSASSVDFADPVFQASGKGRVLVRNTILLFADRIQLDDLPESDRHVYQDLLAKYGRDRNV